ncbi:hypothetical protein PORY_002407 [Pneumocystis oryctolagi]|uniref:Uncharacterized protein n=1 Tax=Pneumocystis oryctolagi TaxID=42067 RepID=A0ACB7C9M8_9ASCO|nr:hypothetical protein PORY_002407 [Pneumocystis oryctolagi]
MLKPFSHNSSIEKSFNEVEIELEEYDTDNFGFLSLQCNAYIQLADAPIGQIPRYNSSLLCIGNKKGYYASGIPLGFVFGTTQSLRESLKSKAIKKIVEHTPLSTIHLQKGILNISFSSDEQYLIVATEEDEIMFYSTQKLFQKNDYLQPDIVFRIENIKDILPNPMDSNVIAVLTLSGNLHMINFSQKNISGPLVNDVTSCSWSQKGKQIVCGISQGKLAQYTPDGSLKAVIKKPKSLNDAYYVSSVLWLENHVFFVVYNDYNSLRDLNHDYLIFIVTRGHNGTISYGKLVDPSPPFGLTSRIDHHFIKYFKNWEPNLRDFIILVATASTDVGIICRNKDDLIWKTLIISNETHKATLPYSLLNDCDTSPIGVALDFTLSENIQKPLFPNDEPKEGPPLPILYLLNNDYVLTGYYVLYIDAIKMGKAYNPICLSKENIYDSKTESIATKQTNFGPVSSDLQSFSISNSKSIFDKTSSSYMFKQVTNNPISFGASSFGMPSLSAPVFGNTSFGSAINTGIGNTTFREKEINNAPQTIKSSFASFASMTKSSNDSPFGNLIQNSFGTHNNNSENIFSKSKPSFSFFDTSRLQNKDEDIDDDKLQIDISVSKDKIDFISDNDPEVISGTPLEEAMDFFSINNERDDFRNNQNQQFNLSESSLKISDPSFEKGIAHFENKVTENIPYLSLVDEQGQDSSDFSLIQKDETRNDFKNININTLSSNESEIFHLSKIDSSIEKKDFFANTFLKNNNNSLFNNISSNVVESSEKLNESHKNDNISCNEIFESKDSKKAEFNQEFKNGTCNYGFYSLQDKKKEFPSFLETSIEVSLDENVLKENFKASLNEFDVYNSKNLETQSSLDSHNDMYGGISKTKFDENYSYFNKNIKNESVYIKDSQLKSQNNIKIFNTLSTFSDNLNIMESKNDNGDSIDFSRPKVFKNVDGTCNYMIEKITPCENRCTIKLKPLLSMSEASRAQSEEKVGLVKEVDIICTQMDNELNIIQKNLHELNRFIEIQKSNNDIVHDDFINIFMKQVEEWKYSEIYQIKKIVSSLLNDVSDFQKTENMNLNSMKSLKKTFVKLEAKHIEVSRFIRARTDHEFTQMIKIRQLGFEHLESQTRLRKICQSIEDSLWKAEEDFALYKAKLIGKANGNIKFPSLDSIKRALGKINSLVQQSIKEVNNLELQFRKLKIETFAKTKHSIKTKTRKNLLSENMSSILTSDMLRKDRFLIILKEIMKKRLPLHTTIYN